MHQLSEIKPVVVDESLTTIEDLELAMELGWSGMALKTCKCQSSDLLFIVKAAEAGIPYTVQDLANPGIALIQSVGLAARSYPLLGVEANSRQFFPATSRPERRVHPGLFNVVEGQVSTASIRGIGFGYRMEEIGRRWWGDGAVGQRAIPQPQHSPLVRSPIRSNSHSCPPCFGAHP